jgi:hypothetical protein
MYRVLSPPAFEFIVAHLCTSPSLLTTLEKKSYGNKDSLTGSHIPPFFSTTSTKSFLCVNRQSKPRPRSFVPNSKRTRKAQPHTSTDHSHREFRHQYHPAFHPRRTSFPYSPCSLVVYPVDPSRSPPRSHSPVPPTTPTPRSAEIPPYTSTRKTPSQ